MGSQHAHYDEISNLGRSARIEKATLVPGIIMISDYQIKYLINLEIIKNSREFRTKIKTDIWRRTILFLHTYIQKRYKIDLRLRIILIIY